MPKQMFSAKAFTEFFGVCKNVQMHVGIEWLSDTALANLSVSLEPTDSPLDDLAGRVFTLEWVDGVTRKIKVTGHVSDDNPEALTCSIEPGQSSAVFTGSF